MTTIESDLTTPSPQLNDHPDWRYLLREIYQMYRFSSAGGSSRIRSHQKEVRHRISKLLDSNPCLLFQQPQTKPVCNYLARALDRGKKETTSALTNAIEHIRDKLHWQYGYDRVPQGLGRKYAFAELAGPNGPIQAEHLILGVVLFAPKTTYPSHSHADITESYVCLSGAVSENDVGVYAPGSLILNPPSHPHRITSGDHEPSLLAYAWVGSVESLTSHKMVFSRSKRKPGML